MDTYKSTNTLNGKFYIGSTTNFENRKRAHLRSKENYPFQNALRKNPEAFIWEVWSDDSNEPILEQAFLDMWYGKEQCYNLNPHADRGPDRTGKKQPEGWGEKHSKKLKGRKRPDQSIRMTENNPATRPEVREKIGDGNRGKVRTQETKDKISETLTGTSWGEHTEDHKEKMSSLHSGEGNPAYGKKHWVNAAGDRKFQEKSPGSEWQNGMKWKTYGCRWIPS